MDLQAEEPSQGHGSPIREPTPSPPIRDAPLASQPALPEQPQFIIICHPAWNDGYNIFLMLPCLNDTGNGLIQSGTIWLAAALIAGNAFDGYLSTSKDPSDTPSRVRLNYDQLPEWWHHTDERILTAPAGLSNASSFVYAVDQSCVISGHLTGTRSAHLCPASEEVWFRDNLMDVRYFPDGLNVPANSVLLRADLQIAFDQQQAFVFVPRGENIVIQFLRALPDILGLYNNQKVALNTRVSGHALFIRFAWASFKYFRHPGTKGPGVLYIKGPVNLHADPGVGSQERPSKRRKSNAPKKTTRQQPERKGTLSTSQPSAASVDTEDVSIISSTAESRQSRDTASSQNSLNEEAEDWKEFSEDFPDLHEIDQPAELEPRARPDYFSLQIYPGYRRIERLREKALEQQRAENLAPKSSASISPEESSTEP
ncbi:hypothetical protein AJ79_02500 [Helicocarpus griseus UAMH5409]|uniref:HNH nuclease domain-containing protein n=1 Tax=Helicocarpus griseus UAMH5409 TaxID=1447875 RepID=A0A2B7XU92_9EURO|nr:hypothetical protein AJ79_02500 [Helicocarpus griseus UAMH5409]